MTQPYFQPANSGPRCSTPRSARLRKRRFDMSLTARPEPESMRLLAEETCTIFLAMEPTDPARARAQALRHVVERVPMALEPDTVFLGGEDPFLFNLMLPCLKSDRHARRPPAPYNMPKGLWVGPTMDGHITPAVEVLATHGVEGLRRHLDDTLAKCGEEYRPWYETANYSLGTVTLYAQRLRQAAQSLSSAAGDAGWAADLRESASILGHVPARPATTMREAMQAYWLAYILVTLEMGGCSPGGGIGLGRLDQFLYPYYHADLTAGRIDRAGALELMELFLLCFRHCDFYTRHQLMTPGSQASLCGVTPDGADAFNDASELLMEASLRLAMPAPYLSLRLHANMSQRCVEMAANFILGGLGFPVVNDEAFVPAFVRKGRSLADARDYICACCYEPTIPGREIYHPSCAFINLPMLFEEVLHGRFLLTDPPDLPAPQLPTFAAVMERLQVRLEYFLERIVGLVNYADVSHANRRYPLMSLFMADCIDKGVDVCAGGARYNPTGFVFVGVVNVIDSLAAIEHCVFAQKHCDIDTLRSALAADCVGHEDLRRRLRSAPKWGNDNRHVDDLGAQLARMISQTLARHSNSRGGPLQPALYSWMVNVEYGTRVGASADGRAARTPISRNLTPFPGADRKGPTALIASASRIDGTAFPNGWALDLRFAPSMFATPETRERFAAFLRGFVASGVPQIQVTMADTKTLRDAQIHPELHQDLLVKAAGYCARFVDMPRSEQEQVLLRTEAKV